MSYCRFSCDNWKSDVYCYESVYDCFEVHVASNRVVGNVPEVPNITTTPTDEWLKAYRKQAAFMKTAERQNIGLPHDGKSKRFETASETIEYLLELRKVGYHVPQHAIDGLREDQQHEATGGRVGNEED